ncbi:dTMP kinase [Marinobacter sp. TBZ242]|uniref:Thymidylate kinase n=1 Tax=Marinobacter azerbaijanicus TaxID=3050455 RepID=A0ABT7I9R7_9GAMM|nr:dTMP kinase [Marinobacter sp. TBZ242]MDL0429963.1 dTMP kinase [Marinobacter sp. TBZ242]
MTSHGQFITFEGTEGVGKSTQLENAADTLKSLGVDVVVTREPGGTPMAESIRELLLAPRDEPVNDMTELLLMFAARAQHLQTLILPELEAGRWVLCDRFTDATFAYQGGGRGVPVEHIAQLENLVQGAFRPDHIVLLDAPVETGMTRARHRGELDRFEREAVDFFERIRQAYLDRAATDPDRYHIVDAAQPLEVVSRDVTSLIRGLVTRP